MFLKEALLFRDTLDELIIMAEIYFTIIQRGGYRYRRNEIGHG